MRLYRNTYLDRKTGKRKRLKNWMVDVRCGGERFRIAAFTDKSASEQFGKRVERLAQRKVAGLQPDLELNEWVGQLPGDLRDNLARIGLLDAASLASARPLSELVTDYESFLFAKGDTESHVVKTIGALKRVFDGCGFTSVSDIDPGALERHLLALRKGTAIRKGIGARQSNYILGAAKSFCTWLVRRGWTAENRLAVLRPLNARVDVRRERRALSHQEAVALLRSTQSAPEIQGMSGPERAMLYRVALETGLRAGELANLRVSAFNLSGDRPTVTLQAAYSKHRREDVLPLRPVTAQALQGFLRGRMPTAMAFQIPKHWRSAEMICEDLVTAGVLTQDDDQEIVAKGEDGRVLDFHALRHTFITNLVRGGVHPKVAQALARHSTITLTLDRYTHLQSDDQLNALRQLPDLDAPPQTEEQEDGRDRDPRVAQGT